MPEPAQPRVPVPVPIDLLGEPRTLQVNHCHQPGCSNLGVPAHHELKSRRAKDQDPAHKRATSRTGIPALRRKACGDKPPVKPNRSVALETERLVGSRGRLDTRCQLFFTSSFPCNCHFKRTHCSTRPLIAALSPSRGKMAAPAHRKPDMFGDVSRRELTPEQAEKVRGYVRRGEASRAFPAGSAAPPMLLAGREPQIASLTQLGLDILNPDQSTGIVGALLHGPRGTGKTALRSIFHKELKKHDVRIISSAGETLETDDALNAHVTIKGELSAKTKWGWRLGRFGRGRAHSAADIKPDIRATLGRLFEGRRLRRPVLISVDEAHKASPETLGRMMNAVQDLAAGGRPIGFLLAGTPDAVDVAGKAQASWFFDRGRANRRLPMGSLTQAECRDVIALPLEAAGIPFDEAGLSRAAAECKGSPYFTQLMGRSALETLFARHPPGQWKGRPPPVDFSPQGEAMSLFDKGERGRYNHTWSWLADRGLTAAARQIGALWRRSQAEGGTRFTQKDIRAGVRSGLEHPALGECERRLEPDPAQAAFRHLGLLWDTEADPSGRHSRWTLGLPSFFDYIEEAFQDPDLREYHALLPALDADVDRIMDGTLPARDGPKGP